MTATILGIIILVVIILLIAGINSADGQISSAPKRSSVSTVQNIDFPNPETASPKLVLKALDRYDTDVIKQIYQQLKSLNVELPPDVQTAFEAKIAGRYFYTIHYEGLNLQNFQEAKYRLKALPEQYYFELKGVHIPARKRILNDCVTFDEVELKKDPKNEYDPNAIKVTCGNRLIGYVPAEETEKVHEIIANHHFAFIYRKTRSSEDYIEVDIILYF
jgi:HIRAN domain